MQGRCRYRVHPEAGLEDAPAAAPADDEQQLAARKPDADGSTEGRQAIPLQTLAHAPLRAPE